jgi:hypothetical protein
LPQSPVRRIRIKCLGIEQSSPLPEFPVAFAIGIGHGFEVIGVIEDPASTLGWTSPLPFEADRIDGLR